MENEFWVPLAGAVSTHEASNMGRIRLKKNGRILKEFKAKHGYMTISINRKTSRVHRLIALTFIPNPENKPQVNHKDFNKSNNSIENLEWMTFKENIDHYYKTGFKGKISEEDVTFIRLNYSQLGPKKLSKMYGVAYDYIYGIAYGRKGMKQNAATPPILRSGQVISSKPIAQLDLQSRIIAIFPSATNAAKVTGLRASAIAKVLKGKRVTYNGFIFRYIDEKGVPIQLFRNKKKPGRPRKNLVNK